MVTTSWNLRLTNRYRLDSTGADGTYTGHNLVDVDFTVGQAIYIEELDGILGTGADMSQESGQIWDSRYDTRRGENLDAVSPDTNTGRKDCNGWWLVSKRGSYDNSTSSTKPHPTQKYIFPHQQFFTPRNCRLYAYNRDSVWVEWVALKQNTRGRFTETQGRIHQTMFHLKTAHRHSSMQVCYTNKIGRLIV